MTEGFYSTFKSISVTYFWFKLTMTPQERLTIIKKSAATGNVIESTIAQNLLDTFYDDNFVVDYLSHLTTLEELSIQTMSETLGTNAESFYKLHKNSVDSLIKGSVNWKLKLSTVLQNELVKLVNCIESSD